MSTINIPSKILKSLVEDDLIDGDFGDCLICGQYVYRAPYHKEGCAWVEARKLLEFPTDPQWLIRDKNILGQNEE